MKIHVFIGTIAYDLNDARKDLSTFVEMHDFEPIMLGDGDVVCNSGVSSRCEAMKLADMVILIIGGKDEWGMSGRADGRTIGKQFKGAMGECIPVYAFVDRQVYAEYGIYEMNADRVDGDSDLIRFRATKDINVFHFINELRDMENLSIVAFDRMEEIKDYLSETWSKMIQAYLSRLRDSRRAVQKSSRTNGKSRQTKELEASLRKFSDMIQEMNVMLNSTGNRIQEVKRELAKPSPFTIVPAPEIETQPRARQDILYQRR